jgi:hypothetical protein
VDVGVFVFVGVRVEVGVFVFVGVRVVVGVFVFVLVNVKVGVLVMVAVIVLVGVSVGVSVLVGLSVGVAVNVGVSVLVGELVGVSVGVSVLVGVLVVVSVGVFVLVEVEVGPLVVTTFKHQPPAITPISPCETSTTYILHVPLGFDPLNADSLVAVEGVGAGAGNVSPLPYFAGRNVPLDNAVLEGRAWTALSSRVRLIWDTLVPLPVFAMRTKFVPCGLDKRIPISLE